MVGGMVAYVFYWQEQEGQEVASHKVSSALSRLNADFARMQTANRDFANKLCANQSIAEDINKQDRSALSSLLKNAIEARNFAGFVTIFDQYGRVLYSSDTPAKSGYSQRGRNGSVDYVLTSLDSFTGLTLGLTPAQSISLTAMVPILGEAGRCAGIVAVSEPIDEEFLTGEAMKFALLSEPIADIDFVLLGVKDRNQISLTPGLVKEKLPFLRELGDHGVTALPSWREPGGTWQVSSVLNWLNDLLKKNNNAGFIKDKHFWQSLNLAAPGAKSSGHPYNADNAGSSVEIIGVIIATTAIHAEGIKPGFIMIISCILGMCAFLLSLVLCARITNFDRPVQALMERINLWQNTRTLPPPSGLSGTGLEMAQLIDQTFLNWQDEMHAVKAHLHKVSMEAGEKAEVAQGTDDQFANLNRQLANQNKQLSEFSRQLNYANQQAVFLQQELQAILQSTTEGFLVLDRYGNVISANNIFLNWLGVSEGEIAGRFCFDLVQKPGEGNNPSGQNPESGRAFVKHESDPSALIDQYFPEGLIYHAQSAEPIEVLLHLQPVAGHDSNIQGYILVVRDKSLRSEIAGLRTEIVNMLGRAIRGPLISAEKEWQHLLADTTQFFKPESAEPTKSKAKGQPPNIQQEWNQELNQELSDASKQRSAVPSNWAVLLDLHSRYQNLIRSVESLLAAHGQSVEQLPSFAPEGQQLVDGLGGIFPPGDAPKVESFPVSRLVGDCLEEVANLARERQLLLDHKTSTALPSLSGNRALIKSILIPAVDKMISITAPGGKVRVESSLKDKEIQLSISSSGPALAEEEIADMFAGFIPGKHNEDSYGSRLSLYLARNNTERIGAHIWAQSEASRGTTVYITFPTG